jgi:hypothetical protein
LTQAYKELHLEMPQPLPHVPSSKDSLFGVTASIEEMNESFASF